MPYNLKDPTIVISTPYGMLTLEFIDTPSKDALWREYTEADRTCLIVNGELLINRVPVHVGMPLSWHTIRYEHGKELPAAKQYKALRRQPGGYDGSYRTDTNSRELTPSIRERLNNVFDTVVRPAYDENLTLRHEAKRVRLAQLVDSAEGKRDAAKAEYEAAEKALLVARRNFAEWTPLSETEKAGKS